MRNSLFLSVFLICAQFSFGNDFFDGLIGGSQGQVSSSKPRNVIPPKSGGKTQTFEVKSSEAEPISPKSEQPRFNPYYDAADFTNFASASVVDGQLVRKRDVNGGTCFGISYFTSMWYSRLVRPVQQNKRAKPFKTHDFDITLWDALWADLSQIGKTEMDGVNFVTLGIQKEKVDSGDTTFFSHTKMKTNLEDYRLYSMSHGEYKNRIQLGAISHHKDQRTISRIGVDTTNPRDTSGKLEQIKQRLETHGTQTFYYHKYKVHDEWYLWDKWEWGHACLIYEIKRVKVKGQSGSEREAWKIRYMDPNATYHKKVNDTEGYGHYLLYFPDSKQLTFSKAIQKWYGIQTRSSVIDNDEVRFGFYDVYEGHPVQDQLAKQGFFHPYIGMGRVLEGDEHQRINEKGKIRIGE